MTIMNVDRRFLTAIRKYVSALDVGLRLRQNKLPRSLQTKLTILWGPRWAKIVGYQRPGYNSAMYFVDMRKGNTYGNVYEAAAWAKPREWWLTNIFGKR